MTATTFDPNQIVVSDTARHHIENQIARSGRKYLRLGIKESGCNGYMYTLDYMDQPEATDESFDVSDRLRLYVHTDDLSMVRGTTIDYVVEGLNANLKFENPRAVSHCGCGESFSINPNG